MAESIVSKLKAKLGAINIPFLKKKEPPSEEVVDPEYNKANKKMEDIGMNSAGAHMDKTNPGIKAPSDATEANNLEDMQEPAKPKMVLFRPIGKTKFTPVHVLVVLGVLYFGYDMMMVESGPSDEEMLANVPPPKPKKNRKKKKDQDAAAVTEGEATTPVDAAATTEVTPTPEAKTGEAVDTIDVSAATPTATPEAQEGSKVEEATKVEDVSLNVEELNTEAEKLDKAAEVKPTATPEPEASVAVEASGEGKSAEEGTLSMTTGESTTEPVAEDTDLASDLLKNLSDGEDTKTTSAETNNELKETAAPDYTKLGRGLVYNCKDGHWACVGRDEYNSCKANRQWNEKSSKKLECYEVSVYATDKDCGSAQRMKVDTVAQTDFCK